MDNKILHVEDNPDDVMLTAMAFRKAGISVQIAVATDGDEAIAAPFTPRVGIRARSPTIVAANVAAAMEVFITGRPRLNT